ncbi:MAG: 4Fe-4S binding protein [Syntrophomonadaceae bacterium]
MFTEIEKLEYKTAERSKRSNKENKFNLLDIPVIKKLLLAKAFPYAIQTVILLVLIGFILLGRGVYTPEGQDVELFAKSNIVCMVIWGIWWPLMIWTVVIFGRLWCMICPLELMSRIGGKIGLLLRIKTFSISRPVKAGFIIVGLYALIQLLAAGTGLHYVPAYTALFLTCLITFAMIIGVVFKSGTFCRGFCPIAMTLNAYSRGSMLAVRAGSANKCAECKAKSCIRTSENKSIFKSGGGCPVNLYPPHLKSNKDCVLCGQCIKSCKSSNMQLLIRLPFNKKDRREKRASWAFTLFIMIDSGFVLGEICEQWDFTDKIFMAVPEYFMNYFNFQGYSGWIEGVWTLFIFPLLLWTIMGIFLKSTGGLKSIIHSWRAFAFRAVIIFSSLHLIKSFLRFAEWSAFLPYAVKDPRGINNAKAFSSGALLYPQSVFNPFIILAISIVILCFALYFFLREKHTGNI